MSIHIFLIWSLLTEFQYFHRDFFFFMEFSHLLLISVGEEATKPCYHPDCEKNFMLMYKINKKTATVAKKVSFWETELAGDQRVELLWI